MVETTKFTDKSKTSQIINIKRERERGGRGGERETNDDFKLPARENSGNTLFC